MRPQYYSITAKIRVKERALVRKHGVEGRKMLGPLALPIRLRNQMNRMRRK